MDFDALTVAYAPNGVALEYGIVHGNSHIVLIKSGRGGSSRGEENKYVKMARRLSERLGCTVICAPNPTDCDCTYLLDLAVIKRHATQNGFTDWSLSLIGSSNGAYQCLLLAAEHGCVSHVLCINMPLMINFHKSLAALRAMEGVKKTFVYGTCDPSCRYLCFLEGKNLPQCSVVCMDGADHCFTGRADVFVGLADLL